MNGHAATQLPLRRLGIDTCQEPVIDMHADCVVCRSEGFAARSRIADAVCELLAPDAPSNRSPS